MELLETLLLEIFKFNNLNSCSETVKNGNNASVQLKCFSNSLFCAHHFDFKGVNQLIQ